jgi:Fe-S cluster assembly protein SufD
MDVAEKDIAQQIFASFTANQSGEAVELKKSALEALKKTGLPGRKLEEYRFTPITAALTKNIDWTNRLTPSLLASADSFLIPDWEGDVIVLLNGVFSKELSKLSASSAKVQRIADAFSEGNPLLKSYFDKQNGSSNDPFSLLNSAFWTDGVFIHVPANAKVEKPIHILHLHDAEKEQVIANTRLLTIVEEGSHFTLIESFHSIGTKSVFNSCAGEIVVKENAQLHYCQLQQDAGNSYQVANTFIHQESGSRVDTFTLTLDGKLVRNNLSIALDGENCESHFHGLYLLKGNTLADNHTVVDHRKPNSFSNEMYKGVMADQSKGVFNGKIFVRPHAQKTNAFQSNRNILLDETATINTKPQLEIWADDVKCSHGCTTGQLDEEALFYLRSRGIPQKEAKALLLHAFASETYANIENERVKAYVEKLISQRLNFN